MKRAILFVTGSAALYWLYNQWRIKLLPGQIIATQSSQYAPIANQQITRQTTANPLPALFAELDRIFAVDESLKPAPTPSQPARA